MKTFLTVPTIHIEDSILNSFRRRAWKMYPCEYFEVLWGWREKEHLYIAASLHVPQVATINDVTVDEDMLIAVHEEAKDHQLKPVGSIHTHPCGKGDDPGIYQLLSAHDHVDGHLWSELISAVCVMWLTPSKKRRSVVKWWIPQGTCQIVKGSVASD